MPRGLLEAAGLLEGPGPRTVAEPDAVGLARRVPWGRHAGSVVALWRTESETWMVADVPAQRLSGFR